MKQYSVAARFVCFGPSVVGSDTHRGLLSKCDIPSASEWVAYYITKEVCLLIQWSLHVVATGEGAEESRPRAGGISETSHRAQRHPQSASS